MIKKITPELIVEDVNETIDFYEEILEFKKIMTMPEKGVYEWALMEKDGNELMFQTKKSLIKEIPSLNETKIGNSMMLYLELTDIESVYKRMKKELIIKELHSTFYGSKEFVIQDCNNYLIIISERIA